MTTENEKIALKLVEGCTHVYPKSTGSCRFCTSEALDAKDLTISQLKADVERLKENQSALQSGGILHNERMRIRKLESEKEALEKRVKKLVDALNKIEAKETCDFGHKEEINILEAKIAELEAMLTIKASPFNDGCQCAECLPARKQIATLQHHAEAMAGILEYIADMFDGEVDIDNNGNPNRAMTITSIVQECVTPFRSEFPKAGGQRG